MGDILGWPYTGDGRVVGSFVKSWQMSKFATKFTT